MHRINRGRPEPHQWSQDLLPPRRRPSWRTSGVQREILGDCPRKSGWRCPKQQRTSEWNVVAESGNTSPSGAQQQGKSNPPTSVPRLYDNARQEALPQALGFIPQGRTSQRIFDAADPVTPPTRHRVLSAHRRLCPVLKSVSGPILSSSPWRA